MNRKALSKQDREKVYRKYNGHCAYCGTVIEKKNMQVDHLIAFARIEHGKALSEDVNCAENYMPSCRSCNHYKSTLGLEDFRECIERFTTVLSRDSVTYRNAVRFGQIIPNKKPVKFYFEQEAKLND